MFENKNIKTLKPYKTSTHRAWEDKDNSQVLKLDWNEATILPSPKVKEAIMLELKQGRINWYPDTNNVKLIGLLALYNNLSSNEVQYFASSDALHEYIVRAFVNDSDRILIIGPTYDNFRAVAESNGANIQNYELNESFKLDYEKFQNDLKLIRPKIVYIVNPNNPTGSIHEFENLKNLIKSNKDIFFIIDEAYFEFSGVTISNLITEFSNLLISRTFSKAFAMASFRIGYVLSNSRNIDLLNKIRNPKNVSHFAQVAAIAALQDLNYTTSYVDEVRKSKEDFYIFLEKLDYLNFYKGEGNFIFIKLHNMDLKKKFISHLEQNYIYIRDYGHIETTKNFVRITIGTVKQMNIVKNAINKFDLKR